MSNNLQAKQNKNFKIAACDYNQSFEACSDSFTQPGTPRRVVEYVSFHAQGLQPPGTASTYLQTRVSLTKVEIHEDSWKKRNTLKYNLIW